MKTNDLATTVRQVGKRSVYTFDQLSQMAKKRVLIIDFRLVAHMEKEVSLKELKKLGVLKGQPQSITTLEDSEFDALRSNFPMVTR